MIYAAALRNGIERNIFSILQEFKFLEIENSKIATTCLTYREFTTNKFHEKREKSKQNSVDWYLPSTKTQAFFMSCIKSLSCASGHLFEPSMAKWEIEAKEDCDGD